MLISGKKIKEIIERNKEVFKVLEEYDKTHKLPFQTKRIDITLSNKTIDKLNKLKEKTGKPISRIVEEKFS